jgi:hypothetical protein
MGRAILTVAFTAVSICSSGNAHGQSDSSTIGGDGAGFYSAQQADRGREAFVLVCAECHSSSEFSGTDFEWQWRRQTAWNLYSDILWNMPEDDPGSLPETTYADVVAYILLLNDYASGGPELSPTEDALGAIPLGPGASKTKTKPTGSP